MLCDCRGGALFLEGVEDTDISGCNFTRLDSNALMLSGYTRNVTVRDNSFTWIGGNTIGLMGKTTMPDQDPRTPFFGWDGRNGEQPRFTTVVGNIAHHIGIWEKQSSFIFQSKSCLNNYTGNIHFHSPRCAINYNDGFGGGSTISRNLFFGTNDETGQGVFNSWGTLTPSCCCCRLDDSSAGSGFVMADRQTYVTDIDVSPGTKRWDEITQNLMINSDHDDRYP